jgi:hypothetical protein
MSVNSPPQRRTKNTGSICDLCSEEIGKTSYIHFILSTTEAYFIHLCCYLKMLAFELENNQMVHYIAGQNLSARQTLEVTTPTECNHAANRYNVQKEK